MQSDGQLRCQRMARSEGHVGDGEGDRDRQYKNLDALGKIDLLLVTHAHGDHLGDAPDIAKKHNAPMIGPAGLNQALLTLGVLPANLAPRMNKGGIITPLGPDIKITMTRAEHSSELVWKNPATGKDETHVGGEPVGFIIEFENGFKVYHMGDTGCSATCAGSASTTSRI